MNFQKNASEGNRFLNELAKELGHPEDKKKAARILKAVLHSIRDIVSTEENIQLLAQFPMFLKAAYVDGWTSRKPKRIKHMDDFLDKVRSNIGVSADYDNVDDDTLYNISSTVIIVLRQYVSFGEMEDITAQMPGKLKDLMSPSGMII